MSGNSPSAVVCAPVRGGNSGEGNFVVLELLVIALCTFAINFPLGFWRGGLRKFSFPWVVAVHAAVPLVVLMRLQSHLGFAWYTYPPIVAAYFGGQFTGARLRRRRLAAG